MKKIITIILAIAMVFAFSSLAFAADISAEQAKQIALTDANVNEADLLYIRVEKDIDDAIIKFEVNFFVKSSSTEYEYDIAIADGRILSKEIEGGKKGSTDPNNVISLEAAIELAKLRAGVGEEATIRKATLDFDDGYYEYDIEIVEKGIEYDITVDAGDGSILEFDQDFEGFSFRKIWKSIMDFFSNLFSFLK